ncbi:MAG: M14 family metallopeptidase [Planctomycetota bacterium]
MSPRRSIPAHPHVSRTVGLVGVFVACVGWLGLGAAPAAAQVCEECAGVQIVRIAVVTAADEAALAHLAQTYGPAFEIWPETPVPQTLDARVEPAALAGLAASGLAHEVLISDLAVHLEEIAAAGDGEDFFSTLRTYDEHVAHLTSLATAYPDLAQAINLGPSVQGRNMWGLRISGRGRIKPGILYFGAQHGNERAGASVVQYVAFNLLSRYGTDPQITALVDRAEWFLVPIANPDGYVVNRRYNAHNVDLNRNWGGPGGPGNAFSEPETQHLRDHILANPHIRVQNDVHGYINKLLWPWGWTATLCEDDALFRVVTTVCRNRIAAAGGGNYDIGPIYTTIYPAPGNSADYSYDHSRIFAWGWEVANSTMPTICQQFLDAMLYLGEWIWTYDCNANRYPDSEDIAAGRSHDCNHNNVPDECDGLGDLNCDDYVNFDDINPFVLALSDPAGYAQAYPDCPLLKRDINGDGVCNFDDINPFVAILGGF